MSVSSRRTCVAPLQRPLLLPLATGWRARVRRPVTVSGWRSWGTRRWRQTSSHGWTSLCLTLNWWPKSPSSSNVSLRSAAAAAAARLNLATRLNSSTVDRASTAYLATSSKCCITKDCKSKARFPLPELTGSGTRVVETGLKAAFTSGHMLPDTSCVRLLPSTCILYRRQNCRYFVARLLLDTKGYKSTVT